MAPESGITAWLERVMLGRGEAAYRRFVRVVGAITALLVGAYALVALEIVNVGPGTAGIVEIAAAVSVAVFVLLGALQFVVLGRAVERSAEQVAETAEHLEDAAAEVETAAAEVETAVEEVEQTAAEAEASPDPVDEARERTETAKEVADEVRERVEDERDRLPDDE